MNTESTEVETPPRRVARYSIVVVRADTDTPQIIISDYWQSWVQDVYVDSRLSVYQVFCPLGPGYFGV